jgi:hypothetical protein
VKVRILLHTEGLHDLEADDREALSYLVAVRNRGLVELMRTESHGKPLADLRGIPVLRAEQRAGGGQRRDVVAKDADRRIVETLGDSDSPKQLVADLGGGDQGIERASAAMVGAWCSNLTLTGDRTLLMADGFQCERLRCSVPGLPSRSLASWLATGIGCPSTRASICPDTSSMRRWFLLLSRHCSRPSPRPIGSPPRSGIEAVTGFDHEAAKRPLASLRADGRPTLAARGTSKLPTTSAPDPKPQVEFVQDFGVPRRGHRSPNSSCPRLLRRPLRPRWRS